jgi:hypothetical protein
MVCDREIAAVSVDSLTSVTVGRLRQFCAGLSSSLGVGVPRLPELATLADVKEFCSGLLENPSKHPLGVWWKALPHRKGMSFAHSLFLFRKVIPVEGDSDAISDAYVAQMSKAQDRADPKFLEFVTKEIPLLFQSGWDSGYRRRAGNLLMPVKACLEAGRRRGGGRSRNGDLRRLRRVALGWEVISDPDRRARVNTVKDGCKLRVVSVSSCEQVALKPLHDLLYDTVSRRDWLLRGDATPESFGDFKRRDGEVFVSGDYEGATDNLSLEVYQHLLRCLRETSRTIPRSVWDLALARSESTLFTKRVKGEQRRGQLMGTFLSFPALCLVNYLVFRYLVRRPVPVRVNGDDIVFRATRAEAEKWMEGVGAAGLVLSRGKTMVNEKFFTLNSTPFQAFFKTVRMVPFVRARAVFTKPDSPASWAGQFKSLCPGFKGPHARFWRKYFLDHHQTQVWLSQRSITRGLGCGVDGGLLRQTRLLRRERFYLSLEEEEPLRETPVGCPRTAAPKGFKTVTRKSAGVTKGTWRLMRSLDTSFGLACRLYASGPVIAPSKRDWTGELQRGTPRYWEPKACVRKVFERTWRRLAAPFAEVKRVGREESLLWPVQGGREGRGGVGMGHRLMAVDEL